MINGSNNTPRTASISERITIGVENKCSQLANVVAAIKNSTETFFMGSEAKRQQNTNKTCGELIQRISSQTKNYEYEVLDVKKLNGSGCISTRFTHKTLTNDVTKLFCSIKNELLNQTHKTLSCTHGHPDKSVNIILATLYQVYQQADKFIQKNINPGHNDLLKSQIFELISNNFIIESDRQMTQNDNVIELLKNINKNHKDTLHSQKEISKEKIEYKIDRYDKIQENLKESFFM
ncbi:MULTISPECIES: hypothetical protein [Gammaproteobacteria]|uniref:hypothetical protein n=1 Tax=Gammaproteobacteria TaxID=1236 RepID=UPI0018661763|nr:MULTISPECIES: hypothetical protein [Gammaproteobacteria]